MVLRTFAISMSSLEDLSFTLILTEPHMITHGWSQKGVLCTTWCVGVLVQVGLPGFATISKLRLCQVMLKLNVGLWSAMLMVWRPKMQVKHLVGCWKLSWPHLRVKYSHVGTRWPSFGYVGALSGSMLGSTSAISWHCLNLIDNHKAGSLATT